MPDLSPIKVTVDTGHSPRYERYGYFREIGNTHIILETAKSERFASAAIPLVSVVDIEDATVEQVNVNARRR